MIVAALAAALLVPQNAPVQPAASTLESPGERVICRKEPGSGTRLSVRVCLTAEEWADRLQAADRDRTHLRLTIDNRRPFPGPGRRR
ncbi:hypothetical protein [Brevundimonas viscosa]|uniref:Uncharacterized protein n=1 Tax=Brevundimonas viscosa TaxID=871741 RepID=A0A1I6S2X1_9CAUL|nr:hypothetical protein [Brevundimonas viscosa]SFS71301.1 hypothetical protein SAMN05192570_2128 [Brevundimonas viscosa]